VDELNSLDLFDLGTQGDRHEREFWPLVSKQFPSYEILWRWLIVPLTFRVDRRAASLDLQEWIRFRPGIPVKYEHMAMAHYSVFYFLGRAWKRFSEGTSFEYPEDVLFLLDSVGDNFKCFLSAMNDIGKDCGIKVFDPGKITQFPKEFEPFPEISAYRDVLLHNTVVGRAVDVEKTAIPRWHRDKSESPLEKVKHSWRAAGQLSPEDLIATEDLLKRLITEACKLLEDHWQAALKFVGELSFQSKMVRVLNLKEYFPLPLEWLTPAGMSGASGSITTAGSNTFVPEPREHGR
jgi:hypothetical protein